jgi:hypothetical protein
MIRLRDRYEAFWGGLLHEAAGAGRLRADVDLSLLRFLIFGATNWITMWYSATGSRTPDEITDAFWDLIANGAAERAGRARRTARRELVAVDA